MTRAWFSLVKTDNELKDINPVLLEILENNLVFSEKAVMSLTDKDINSFRVTAEDFENFFRPSKYANIHNKIDTRFLLRVRSLTYQVNHLQTQSENFYSECKRWELLVACINDKRC